jgi:hypothetical protein
MSMPGHGIQSNDRPANPVDGGGTDHQACIDRITESLSVASLFLPRSLGGLVRQAYSTPFGVPVPCKTPPIYVTGPGTHGDLFFSSNNNDNEQMAGTVARQSICAFHGWVWGWVGGF